MKNRYAGACGSCGGTVPPSAGTVVKHGRRWSVRHWTCANQQEARVITIRTSGGTFYRNTAGRCEDAPCCGCCTI
jgi:hypothetical protein